MIIRFSFAAIENSWSNGSGVLEWWGSILHYSSTPLLQHFAYDSGAYGVAAFSYCKPEPLFHRDRLKKLTGDGDVIARHHHLHSFRKVHRSGHIRGPEIELRTIPGEERSMPSTLFLG